MALHAQVNRFFYDYTYAPDSLQPAVLKKEIMILDVVGNEGSVFMSYKKFRADSLASADPQKFMQQAMGNGAAILGDFTYTVKKTYPDRKVYFYEKIGKDLYQVRDDKKLNWIISPEKRQTGNYLTQKAVLIFGGREWEAWFTTAIPLQEGPYKFHGLPGLIVKIEDKTHTHSLVLAGHETVSTAGEQKSPHFKSYVNEFQVDEQQFKRLWKASLNDPGKILAGSGTSSHKTVVFNNGVRSEGTTREMAGSILKARKEREKRYSNKIEPDLYQ